MKMQRLLIMAVWLITAVSGPVFANDSSATGPVRMLEQGQAAVKNDDGQDPKYAGYTIDGFATASQLAAQRSHTVAGKDERNFAIFTGITAILIVYFFTQFTFFDK